MAARVSTAVTAHERAARVKAYAEQLGFDRVGITDLSPPAHADRFREWLDRGYAGTMRYMHRQAPRRLEPARIVRGTTRAVVITKNYFHPEPPPQPGQGRVARYARGRDYHVALAPALTKLAAFVRDLGSADTIARWYVDAGPVPERELAQRAGIGWIGKNTMLIDPESGSYCFLAAVLTNADLAVDPPFEADRCGSCRRCLDACPTEAFTEERVLDARRCISYLTIEHRGPMDSGLASLVDDWIFGCDVCQEVCPWNVKFAEPSDAKELEPSPELAWLEPSTFAGMSATEFDTTYGETALSRPGIEGMRRNAAVVTKNIGRTTHG